jgi:hypothetical protein
MGGAIGSVMGGTIEVYASALLPGILAVVDNASVVVINRSVTPPVCYVGGLQKKEKEA